MFCAEGAGTNIDNSRAPNWHTYAGVHHAADSKKKGTRFRGPLCNLVFLFSVRGWFRFRLRYAYRPDVETFCAEALALGTLTYPLTVSLPTLLMTISSGILVPEV